MFRFLAPAAAIAAMLVSVQPSFAEPPISVAPEHVQIAQLHVLQPTAQQPSPAPSSADVPTPATTGYLENMIPVGFGWG